MINPVRPIARLFARMRRSRGFGVHSPFAFGFITAVLTCRYPYYCFDDLRADVAHAGGALRPSDAMTLFRVIDQFNPREVTVTAPDDGIRVVIRHWRKECRTVSAPSEFIIVTDSDRIPALPADGEAAVFFTRDAFPAFGAFREAMESGMTFTNGKTAIALCFSRLPRQDFELNY